PAQTIRAADEDPAKSGCKQRRLCRLTTNNNHGRAARTSIAKEVRPTYAMAIMDFTSPNSISVFDSLRLRMMMQDAWVIGDPRVKTTEDRWSRKMIDAIRQHWPEYLMEAAELGLFMLSACAFTVLLFHPLSPVAQSIQSDVLRRI